MDRLLGKFQNLTEEGRAKNLDVETLRKRAVKKKYEDTLNSLNLGGDRVQAVSGDDQDDGIIRPRPLKAVPKTEDPSLKRFPTLVKPKTRKAQMHSGPVMPKSYVDGDLKGAKVRTRSSGLESVVSRMEESAMREGEKEKADMESMEAERTRFNTSPQTATYPGHKPYATPGQPRYGSDNNHAAAANSEMNRTKFSAYPLPPNSPQFASYNSAQGYDRRPQMRQQSSTFPMTPQEERYNQQHHWPQQSGMPYEGHRNPQQMGMQGRGQPQPMQQSDPRARRQQSSTFPMLPQDANNHHRNMQSGATTPQGERKPTKKQSSLGLNTNVGGNDHDGLPVSAISPSQIAFMTPGTFMNLEDADSHHSGSIFRPQGGKSAPNSGKSSPAPLNQTPRVSPGPEGRHSPAHGNQTLRVSPGPEGRGGHNANGRNSDNVPQPPPPPPTDNQEGGLKRRLTPARRRTAPNLSKAPPVPSLPSGVPPVPIVPVQNKNSNQLPQPTPQKQHQTPLPVLPTRVPSPALNHPHSGPSPDIPAISGGGLSRSKMTLARGKAFNRGPNEQPKEFKRKPILGMRHQLVDKEMPTSPVDRSSTKSPIDRRHTKSPVDRGHARSPVNRSHSTTPGGRKK